MSLGLLIQHITVLLSLGTAVFALSRWRNPRSLFFICYTITIAIFAVGYLLETTSTTIEAATVACKVQYYGIPYIAPLYYLLCRDYSNVPLRRRGAIFGLMALPVLSTVLVNTWPQQHLFYADLSFSTGGFVNHLVVTPGPLYYLQTVYNAAMMILGLFHVVRIFLQGGENGRRHMVIFMLASVIVVAGGAFSLFRPVDGWDLMPLALTLNAVVLSWYIAFHRQREWTTMGREAVMEHMKDAYVLLDNGSNFLDANQAAYHYFPQLDGLPAGASPLKAAGFPAQLMDGTANDVEFTLEGEDGTLFLRASRSPLEVGGRKMGTSILIFDDTENRHLLDELQQMATHDALTGLYNRGTFFKYATRDFDLARRKQMDGCVLMMDIDHFKLVNDDYGHQAGDKVLVNIAKILRARLRHTDITGRYGGEELAVWLPDAAPEGAAIIADVIRRAVEHTTYESEKGRFNVTISIGVAGVDHTRQQNFDQLVSEADEALYRAKREGRNRVCRYQPSTDK